MKTINYLIILIISLILFGCSKSDVKVNSPNGAGKGGSMARFTIIGDYLYSLDNNKLITCNISNPANTSIVSENILTDGVETIFPFKDYLFIGTQTGMLIYNISNPAFPSYISTFTHVYSCDPVVANDSVAFVTLRNGTTCNSSNVNRLEVIDIKNIFNPRNLVNYNMDNPFGLGLDGKYLFVCNGSFGLKIFDVSQPSNLVEIKDITGITTYDVITNNNILLVTGSSGFYQYDYSDINNIKLISQILKGE